MLHFTFFHAKMARENFIQRTHFNTAENQQILYKRAPHFIGDPFANGSKDSPLPDFLSFLNRAAE